jgi:hypothetical protein
METRRVLTESSVGMLLAEVVSRCRCSVSHLADLQLCVCSGCAYGARAQHAASTYTHDRAVHVHTVVGVREGLEGVSTALAAAQAGVIGVGSTQAPLGATCAACRQTWRPSTSSRWRRLITTLLQGTPECWCTSSTCPNGTSLQQHCRGGVSQGCTSGAGGLLARTAAAQVPAGPSAHPAGMSSMELQ